ncbi:MAG: ABC transporter ATP-binding protein [Lachnospiraceae bacterium]|nr:ABC transporter ATP-binding protein [Lachnospiraceae bacterium]
MKQVVIEVEHLKKIYNKGKSNALEAIRNLTMDVERGEIVAVVGPSGAGKSTLLHILAFIDETTEGKYLLDGEDVTNLPDKRKAQIRASRIGLVMQDYALVEDFSAIENVLLPLDFDRNNKRTAKEKKRMATEALKVVEMERFARQKCSTLSGGQKQRVAIARAIVNHPEVVIADEPTGALDSKNAVQVMEIFKKIREDGKTIIFVTHDMNIAKYADRIIEIRDGEILERPVTNP